MVTANSLNYKEISKSKRIWDKIRHGLILQVLRNRLVRIGIEFTPYYWVKENKTKLKQKEFREDFSKYKIGFLDKEDMKFIGTNARGYSEEEFIDRLNKGKKCFGMKYNDNIVAFTWIDFDECSFKPNKIQLKKNEVYLFSMYTMESFRGRNIAPLLRQECYKTLEAMGIENFYSVSEFFNTAAIKYKKKLGAKNEKLILYIELFKKWHWSFIIKSYN